MKNDNTNGLYGLKDETKLDIFTGSYHTDERIVDPLVKGFAFFIPIKFPAFMGKDPYKKNIDVEYFKQLTVQNFKGFSGITEYTLEGMELNSGFGGNKLLFPGTMPKGNNEITITFDEFSGSKFSKFYQTWVHAIRDPETGTASYPRRTYIANPADYLKYKQSNHTGTYLYIVTRPDADLLSEMVKTEGITAEKIDESGVIEFAALYTNAYPTRENLSQWDFTEGNQELTRLEMTFAVYLNYGVSVTAFANEWLATHGSKYIYDFNGQNVKRFKDGSGALLGSPSEA